MIERSVRAYNYIASPPPCSLLCSGKPGDVAVVRKQHSALYRTFASGLLRRSLSDDGAALRLEDRRDLFRVGLEQDLLDEPVDISHEIVVPSELIPDHCLRLPQAIRPVF